MQRERSCSHARRGERTVIAISDVKVRVILDKRELRAPTVLRCRLSDSSYAARRSLTIGKCACPATCSTSTSNRAPGLPATSA